MAKNVESQTTISFNNDCDFMKSILLESLQDLANENLPNKKSKCCSEEPTLTMTISGKRTRSQSLVKNPKINDYQPDEIKFYKSLDTNQKNMISEVETSIININEVLTPIRFKILLSNIDEKLKAHAIKKLEYLYDLDSSSSEYYKITHWIDSVCKIPINKFKTLPIKADSPKHEIRNFLLNAKNNLNSVVYGHTDAKEQIIRLLAQWIVNPKSKGMVIGIHGPMGCGKTTLIKDSICHVLNLPFAFIPLGGASDGCYLEGHSYTYEGATWGKIVDVLMKSGCMNPVLFFDELDKVSETNRGQEIINILIHLTDASQNEKYSDKYFNDFEFDLSKCLIIFSFNNENQINPILKDRMICIETKGYNTSDKVLIAQNYMLPKLLEDYNFRHDDIVFTNDIIIDIINSIDLEDGVRNLKRAIQNIISHMNLNRLINEHDVCLPYTITNKDVKSYIRTKTNDTLSLMYM